jgi:hypothetical protein
VMAEKINKIWLMSGHSSSKDGSLDSFVSRAWVQSSVRSDR